ncbi:MAG TPA: hypothetical protein VGF50_03555 [Caulobacteraceae bacterium]|jgi:hypothetical protein
MSDDQAATRVAEYLKLAEQMRTAADRAFDPAIAAAYLALASKWVRLAEQTQRSLRYIDRTAADPDKPGNRH